ncbi:hypothetical protein Bache_1287 [Bacteroides helcogenes P 36-108]|uniref:Uncharacterized protein n=1 Tax=Bacteroides helcogenes (strain ATCC 35417 / DSM 20613 / JCM 6297 / CCUG 15421 / P 36-108) TaxID=693979 RepID=E6STZ4_BACT6|nr:hypothetical protein Bache_1287 [Bacteroides helcogenes P 36-108]
MKKGNNKEKERLRNLRTDLKHVRNSKDIKMYDTCISLVIRTPHLCIGKRNAYKE